jgi:hypothetical protein
VTNQRILTTGFLQKKLFPRLIELAPGGKMTLNRLGRTGRRSAT